MGPVRIDYRGEMARLTDLPPAVAKRYAELECPSFATTPWVDGPPLAERRVAIVSSAGLVVRGEKPFRGRHADYRVIPSETRPDQLMFSHISINLDRSGFQEDWNVVFPLDRLGELAAEGVIRAVGAAAHAHVGKIHLPHMEHYVHVGAAMLQCDQVDAGLLSPACPLW